MPYAVKHAGGTSTVIVNQRLNGGQWNLLGTYSFESGTNYKVELSDAVTAGKVAADAVYIASAGGPPSDAFTWTPAIPSSGTYTVYARWPASSANTAAAEYTVTHTGGTANVTLNQKQNGGTWVALGAWSFAPAAGHKVTLSASAEGTTIADAMLFVAASAQPANLLYVHADHLGSPQKMTDASQATVWDGVFDPFGEEVAITGLAAMPLRFPGQYADEETGYSYNYFRDYDFSIGRYVQSDPIGLAGGINTYAYVSNGPVISIDRTGLLADCMPGSIDDLIIRDPNCIGTGGGGGGGPGGGGGVGIGTAILITGIIVVEGAIDYFCPDDEDEGNCDKIYNEEKKNCWKNWGEPWKHIKGRNWMYTGCLERARERWIKCKNNGGTMPADAPPPWSDADVDGFPTIHE